MHGGCYLIGHGCRKCREKACAGSRYSRDRCFLPFIYLTRGLGLTFIDAVTTCMKKYAEFSGRASRSEYWWFVLFIIAGSALLSMWNDRVGFAFYLITLLPSISAATRRLHDRDRSGWFQLVVLIPVIGVFILIYFLVQEGTGPNQHGGPATGTTIGGSGAAAERL